MDVCSRRAVRRMHLLPTRRRRRAELCMKRRNLTQSSQRTQRQQSTKLKAAVLLVFSLATGASFAASNKIPRLASGKPDFSGIWQTTSVADFDLEPHSARKDAPPGVGIVEGGEIPYLPAA